MLSVIISLFVFIFGLSVGSFLNAAVYRFEHKKTLGGRSFCPHCRHQLSWRDLIPIVSFIMLGGKCRYCKKSIPLEYPLVELATGTIFLLLLHTSYSSVVNFGFLVYFAAILLFLFIYDLKHYLIPDAVLIPAIGIALIYDVLVRCQGTDTACMVNYGLGAGTLGLLFFLLFAISKGTWLGFGDVKLVLLMGLLLGLAQTWGALMIASLAGSLVGLGLIAWGKKGLKSQMPFAPFLVFGTFCMLLFGQPIIQWYVDLLP